MSALSTRLVRLLNMVPYFQANPRITRAEAAAELGVTAKQLEEDLNQLWMCGLPGYSPGDLIDFEFCGDTIEVTFSAGIDRPLKLTSPEATGLLVALRALADIPGVVDPQAARSAIAKIAAAAGAVAAVAVQNPTITAVGAGRCSIRAIADQGTPEQRLGGRIDHGQQILFQRLRRSVGRLGARIGATGGVQRLHEAVMKCRGLSVQRLIVRGVITEQPCDSLRYLVGSGRQHRGRGRRCRRVCRTQRCADIRDILRRRRQHLWSCRDKRHQPPSQPVM